MRWLARESKCCYQAGTPVYQAKTLKSEDGVWAIGSSTWAGHFVGEQAIAYSLEAERELSPRRPRPSRSSSRRALFGLLRYLSLSVAVGLYHCDSVPWMTL